MTTTIRTHTARRLLLSLAVFWSLALPAAAQFQLPKPGQFPKNPFGPKFPPTGFPPQVLPGSQFKPAPGLPGAGKKKYQLGIRGSFTPKGMLISAVLPDTPGARAGLKVGDLILKMDDAIVTSPEQLKKTIDTSGGTLQLIVRHPGVNGTTDRMLLDLTNEGCGRIQAAYTLGIRGFFTFQGMTIRKVYSGTPAAQVGLKVGDTIVRINNELIRNQNEFYRVLYQSAGTALVDVRRGIKLSRIKVRLALYRFGTLGPYNLMGFRPDLVAPATPAARAGIKPLDQILSFDGKPVRSNKEFNLAMDQSGGSLIVALRRGFGGAAKIKMNVVNNSLGCWCEPNRGNMRILTVSNGTLAQRIGLQRGDAIFRVNRTRTLTLAQLQSALESARGLLTIVYRSRLTGQLRRVIVDLGK